MLFLVLVMFFIFSIILVVVNRDKKAWYMMALCVDFLLMFTGIIIYFAKIGGLTMEQRRFFFLDTQVQQAISYLNLSLPEIGYMIAVGRYLFPPLLLLLAWEYNTGISIAKYRIYQIFVWICPAVSLFIYYPPVFYKLFPENSSKQKVLILLMISWILFYVVMSLVLLLKEYYCATIRFSKKMFRNIIIFLASIAFVYLSYALQDPVQVYRMYSIQYSSFYTRSYLSLISNVEAWYGITLMSVIIIGVGVWNIQKYGKLKFDEKKGELKLQKKMRDAHTAVPVFVHSIKNQILAEKVLQKRMAAELEKENPNKENIQRMLEQLDFMNKSMLDRMEELYRSVKTKYIHLTPTNPEEILENADRRFHQKYPQGKVEYSCEKGCLILADKVYLGEAVGNLLTNAYESAAQERPLSIQCTVKAEKLYLLIHIQDNGRGIEKDRYRKIFEPFYTSKNTNHNWGMGLAYVMQTVKEHLGMVQVESIPGKGTDFYVYIPLYRQQE